MPAGSFATAPTRDGSTLAPPAPGVAVGTRLTPRPLARGERSRRVVHVYYSPRNTRVVTIADAINACLGLKLEFDPTVLEYVERPVRLQIGPREQVEVEFWSRHRDGEQRYHVVLPAGPSAAARREELERAAERHGIVLHFTPEEVLRSEQAWLRTAEELLEWVWWHARLVSRSTIRAQIKARLAAIDRVTLTQLVATLAFPDPHIRAVVAAMIHDGSLRLVDYTPGAEDALLEVARA